MIWTKAFWQAAAERAVKTFAQALVAVLTGGAVGLLEVDWLRAVDVSALAALVSLLTSLASSAVSGGGPSLTNSETLTSGGDV